MHPRRRRSRLAGALPAVLLAAALAPAALAPGARAAAMHPARPATAARQAAGPLTIAQAAARSHASGKPVIVSSLTTASSEVTAEPHGSMKVTESLQPVRTRQDGQWVAINPDLHKASGGRLAPLAASAPLSLSAGGTGPLAVMESDGRTLTLSWPGGALPTPAVSGPTATYADIEPGIDLVMTATGQGSVEETVVVHTAAAAASPGLAAALQLTGTGPGLTLAAAGGSLAVTGSPGGQPLFTAAAPRVWDSAAPPAATATATVNGAAVVAGSGLPAYSTPTAPGAFANIWQGNLTAAGTAITIAPPSATAPAGTTPVYPVYIDPSFKGVPYAVNGTAKATAWTQIDSGHPTDTGIQDGGWNISGAPYLEVGYCDPSSEYDGDGMGSGCGGIGITRSLLQFTLPVTPPSDTTVTGADIDLDDLWQFEDCQAEPLELWHIPTFSSATSWNSSEPDWSNTGYGEVEQVSPAGFGYSGCGNGEDDITFGENTTPTWGSTTNLDNVLSKALDDNVSTIAFGLRANDESTTDGTSHEQWRYFQDTGGDLTLSFYFHYPPSTPVVSTYPGGPCQNQAQALASPIGADKIDIEGTIIDNDGDTGLTTPTIVYNSSGQPVLIEGGTAGPPTGSGPPTTLGSFSLGTLTTGIYKIQAQTVDSFSEDSGTATCYFYYDTAVPAITVTGVPTSVTYGQPITGLTFAPDGETCSSTPDPCPAYYTYQIGAGAPQKVTANASGTWTGSTNVNVQEPGPFTFTVTGVNAAGNPSSPSSFPVTVAPPAGTIPDGYYSDGSYPDLITTDIAARDPSIWLSPGTKNGTVGPATDIGSLGDDLSPGKDGPADWNGAAILHGNFELSANANVQDIMGFWGPASTTTEPTPGTGVILTGTDNLTPINPFTATSPNISALNFCDPSFDGGTCFVPSDLVYAGNASQGQGTGDDLIGIDGSTTAGYELIDYYAANEPGAYHGYLELETPSMAGQTQDWQNFMIANWGDFTLATAQMDDTAYPQGDPANTVLIALDNQPGNAYSGDLFEATSGGPGGTACTQGTGGPCYAGQPGTWAQVTGTPAGWATSPPTLASADVNNGQPGAVTGPGSGSLEIWTTTAAAATPYVISGSGTASPAVAVEGASSALDYPTAGSWTLGDGGANPNATSVSTAADSLTGTTDTVTGTQTSATQPGTYDWVTDDAFGSVYDGTPTTTSGSVIAPLANPVTTATTPSLSVWFKTTAANDVLVSVDSSAITNGEAPNTTTTAGYNPLMYVGSDGKLYAEWWNGHAYSGITSANPVNDGQWHHAVLTGNTTSQSLTIDGGSPQTVSGNLSISVSGTEFYIGGGYLGGGWPDESHYQEAGNNGYLTYFSGELADVTLNP